MGLVRRTTGLALAATLAASPAVVISTSPVQARSCTFSNTLRHSGGSILGARQIFCDPDDTEGSYLLVTVQRLINGVWVNVAFADGDAALYPCPGTALTSYRLKEVTSKKITVACG
ncbi:hypothetical protein ACGFNU_49720 [Spirillospora sp. NPDC048911]|uniref:hypothetical protein n=1 Tax=Spirillospora sp. NPDC048911 TaxID=3364527 RepID=UPI00371A5807